MRTAARSVAKYASLSYRKLLPPSCARAQHGLGGWPSGRALRYASAMPHTALSAAWFAALSRPLFVAGSLSLLLHLLALFGWRQFSAPVTPPLPPLQVVVGQPQPADTPSPVPQRQASGPPLPAPKSAPPPSRAHAARNARREVLAVAEPLPRQSPASVPAVSVPPAALPDATPPPAGAAQPEAPGGAAAAGSQAARGDSDGLAAGADPDALRAYRIELASAARRFRNYPALARSRGWEGVVEVAVVAGPIGPPAVQLVRTSGHAVLDEQAIDMLTRAAARTPLPDSLRSRGFRILLPIRFSLDE